jgi:hypothetical protein
VEIAGPLAYDGQGWDAAARWHIPLNYELSNIGMTPATDVEFIADILPFVVSGWSSDL